MNGMTAIERAETIAYLRQRLITMHNQSLLSKLATQGRRGATDDILAEIQRLEEQGAQA